MFESILSESIVMHNVSYISMYCCVVDVVVCKDKATKFYVMIVMLVCA